MKKFLLIFLSAFVFFSCSDEIPNSSRTVKQGRTIYAYLIANNSGGDLGAHLKSNIKDMYAGLAQTEGPNSLLVYYRPRETDKDLPGPSILEFRSNGRGKINGRRILTGNDLTEKNVLLQAKIHGCNTTTNHIGTDPETIKSVFKEMQRLSPATQYGIIFGSHGSGWIEGKSVQSKSFGDDMGYSINVPELANVMKETFEPGKIDFILFDACMMGTAEVCYEFKDVTKHCVASVLETPLYGFPYALFFPTLYAPNVDYHQICSRFIQFNESSGTWGTVAAVDCSQMDNLAACVKDNLLKYRYEVNHLNYTNIQQYGKSLYRYFSFDIIDLFKSLNNGVVPEDLQRVMNEVVIAKDCLEKSGTPNFPGIPKDRFCGIGMYLPNLGIKANWDAYYPSLAWYDAVGWSSIKE